MLGRTPPIVLALVGLVLVCGLTFASFWFLVKPKQAEISTLEQNISSEQSKADQRQSAEEALEEVKKQWEIAHASLAATMDERSVPLSMGHPMISMMSLWQEIREDLPRLVEEFVAESGCVIIREHPGWNVPMDPFPANTEWIEFPLGAASGGGTTVSAGSNPPLWVAGTLQDVERLYKSLRNFPRVLTIQHLGLIRLRETAGTELHDTVRELLDRPDEEIVVAPLIMSVFLMCEAADGGGGGAAGGMGGGGMGGGMPGGGMGGPGGPPGGGMGGPGGPPGGGGMPGGGMGGPGGPPGGGGMPGGDMGGPGGPPGGGGMPGAGP